MGGWAMDHGEFEAREAHADAGRTGVSVLLVSLARHYGGADVRVVATARALADRGWPFAVAVLAGSPLHARLAAEGLPVAPLARRRSDPRLVLDLRRLARALGADVVDAHNPQSQYWGALAAVAGRVPGRIATVHSVYRETHPKLGQRQLHEGSLHVARAAGCRFVAVSATVRDHLTAIGVPAARLELSWNGIEPLAAAPAPSLSRRALGWPEDAFVVAVVGRLEPVKGHAHLVAALGELAPAARRRVRVHVVGEGREEARLKAMVAARGLEDVVHFAGFRDDVPAVLAATDLVCMPSLSEGLPYTALEAGRQSVPLLASRVGGLAAAFDDDTAFFVPPADPAALARRLGEIVAAPARRAAVAAAFHRRVTTRFSLDHMTDETLAVYRRAVAAGGRPDPRPGGADGHPADRRSRAAPGEAR